MWIHHSGGFGFGPGEEPSSRRQSDRGLNERERESRAAHSNSPDDVLGEVGLTLVIILGVVLAINAALVVFHIA